MSTIPSLPGHLLYFYTQVVWFLVIIYADNLPNNSVYQHSCDISNTLHHSYCHSNSNCCTAAQQAMYIRHDSTVQGKRRKGTNSEVVTEQSKHRAYIIDVQ